MKIQFSIHFKTNWGQSLVLFLHTSPDTTQNVMMSCSDKSVWTAEINLDTNTSEISYQYSVLNTDKSTFFEYGGMRHIQFPAAKEKVSIIDNWRASYGETPFKSTAFSNCFFKRSNKTVTTSKPDEIGRAHV